MSLTKGMMFFRTGYEQLAPIPDGTATSFGSYFPPGGTFGASGLPPGATINPTTGVVTGMPVSGTYCGIRIIYTPPGGLPAVYSNSFCISPGAPADRLIALADSPNTQAWYSDDRGATWTASQVFDASRIAGITKRASLWICTMQSPSGADVNGVWTSSDGASWTQQIMLGGSNGLTDYDGASKLVCPSIQPGTTVNFRQSTNSGVSWTEPTAFADLGGGIINWCKDRWIYIPSGSGVANGQWSFTGVGWNNFTRPVGTGGLRVTGVDYINGAWRFFCQSSDSSDVHSSVDLATFTSSAFGLGGNVGLVPADHSNYRAMSATALLVNCIVGGVRKIIRTTNGTTWSIVFSPSGATDITYVNGVFYLLDSNTNTLYKSTDDGQNFISVRVMPFSCYALGNDRVNYIP